VKKPVLIVLAVVVLVGGGVAAYLLTKKDDTTKTATAPDTTSTSFSDGTTTTALPLISTTTTTARTTTTTARKTTATTPKAATTTTTGVVAPCGSGKATVSFAAKDLVTDAISSTFTPQVTVNNQVSNPIEVDDVTIDITYPGNVVKTVHFTTAGTVIGAGTSASFTADKLTTVQRYDSVKFTRFAYFTSGQRAGCLVATP
jgi:hypothetical protein